jgi:acid phosphatase
MLRTTTSLALFVALAISAVVKHPLSHTTHHTHHESRESSNGGLMFLGIGDWGGAALGDYHKTDEIAVAKQMVATAQSNNISYIVNVGDNFYYNGVSSTSDPQWGITFENIFTDPTMQVMWYGALGNHDYAGNVQAQLDYTKQSPRWYMPARYYTKRLPISYKGDMATFVFWDTNPCVQEYRSDDPSGWDPNTQQFHDNVISQDCQAQYAWLEKTLASITDDWIISVNHHPLSEVDVVDATSLLEKYGVSISLAGHVHKLMQIGVDGFSGDNVITGAGCMIRLDDSTDAAKTSEREEHGSGTYSTIWEMKRAGFTIHQFSEDVTSLTNTYIDYTGANVNQFTTKLHSQRKAIKKELFNM